MNKELPHGYYLKSPLTEEDFEAYYQLRWDVLRAPWHQPKGSEQDEQDKSSYHLMVVNPDNKIIACGRLQLNNPQQAQIRYMAVDPNERGRNLGAAIISGLEEKAIEWKAKEIFLQAREGAIPFYLSCGFEIIEKTFLLYNEIQHYSMHKTLANI